MNDIWVQICANATYREWMKKKITLVRKSPPT